MEYRYQQPELLHVNCKHCFIWAPSQAGDERGGVRLPGAGDHQEPCEEVLSVHQLPHLRVEQQGEANPVPTHGPQTPSGHVSSTR